MVSSLAITFMIITFVISLFVPLIFMFILMRRRKGVFGIWVAGALGFAIPQLIVRIPLLQLLGTSAAFQRFSSDSPVIYAFFLALTAGLFETAGRLAVLKGALGKRLSYTTGLCAGAGHGGIESIVLVGLTYINNLIMSIFINNGNLSMLFPNDPAMADSVRKTLLGTPPELFLMAGFERIFTMVFQIALTILFTLLIIRRQAVAGFFVVAFLHAALDFSVVLMQLQGISSWVIEALILIIAILSMVFIIKVRPLFGDSQAIPTDPGEQAVKEGY